MRGFRLPLSIHTKLTLWYSGVLLAILVAIGVLSYSWLSFGLQQDLDASLLTVAQVIKDTGSSEQGPGESEALLSWIGSLFDPKIAVYAVPNNGGWYDFGFFVGITVLGGGSWFGSKRHGRS